MEVVPSPALSLEGHFGCVGNRRWQSTLPIFQVPLTALLMSAPRCQAVEGGLSSRNQLVSGPFAGSGESVSRTSVAVSYESSQEVVTQLT